MKFILNNMIKIISVAFLGVGLLSFCLALWFTQLPCTVEVCPAPWQVGIGVIAIVVSGVAGLVTIFADEEIKKDAELKAKEERQAEMQEPKGL